MSNEKTQGSIRYHRVPGWIVAWVFVLTVACATLTLIKRSPVISDPLLAEISANHPVIWRILTDHNRVEHQPLPFLGRPIGEYGYERYLIKPKDEAISYAGPRVPYYVHHSLEPQQKLPFSFDELFLTLTMLGSLALLLSRSNSIQLKPEGITFPETFFAALKLRPVRAWSDIAAISLVEAPKHDSSAKPSPLLRFHFKSGEKIDLDVSRFSCEDLETLLIAIEDWGDKCAVASEIITMRHKLAKSSRSANKTENKSYTAMWEDDLNSHFAATNFVSLKNGHELQSGRYRIAMQLGAGGLAAVYLAEDDSKRMVAVKESVIPPLADAKLKDKAREMFKRESQLLSRVNHPNIVKVLDHFVENERDYMVLEYIPGRTLREIVRRDGAQDPERVLDWAMQIAGILDYLHTQEPAVVHRDLTPDNLVVTAKGVVHLIDFGASNEFVGQATGTFVGKQLYIAPEQFRGKAEPASDIYAMGATLHFLLTGKDPSALAESHPKKILPSLSDAWDELVADATKLSVNDRLHSAANLATRLQAMKSKQVSDEKQLEARIVLKVPAGEDAQQLEMISSRGRHHNKS